ncbi:MAG: hypothetical protein NTW94_08695 [Legionellales bacterium]|nr:hypothetical protein [Legionellales bacterium]
MLADLLQQYNHQLQSFYVMFLVINAILHVIFAGAVARDAGHLYQRGQRPALVSAATWAFATLIGGVFTATIYWFIHHSTLTLSPRREIPHDKS